MQPPIWRNSWRHFQSRCQSMQTTTRRASSSGRSVLFSTRWLARRPWMQLWQLLLCNNSWVITHISHDSLETRHIMYQQQLHTPASCLMYLLGYNLYCMLFQVCALCIYYDRFIILFILQSWSEDPTISCAFWSHGLIASFLEHPFIIRPYSTVIEPQNFTLTDLCRSIYFSSSDCNILLLSSLASVYSVNPLSLRLPPFLALPVKRLVVHNSTTRALPHLFANKSRNLTRSKRGWAQRSGC